MLTTFPVDTEHSGLSAIEQKETLMAQLAGTLPYAKLTIASFRSLAYPTASLCQLEILYYCVLLVITIDCLECVRKNTNVIVQHLKGSFQDRILHRYGAGLEAIHGV